MNLYTTQRIASLWEVEEEVIDAHAGAGRLLRVNIGTTRTPIWRYTEKDIEEFINSLRQQAQQSESTKLPVQLPAQARRPLRGLYRINVKPSGGDPKVDSRAFCLEQGVAGMGWDVPTDGTVLTWDEYQQRATRTYPDGSWRPVIPFHDMPVGAVVWTRSGYGPNTKFWAGQVTSAWVYKTDDEYINAGVPNVRKVSWRLVGDYTQVPPEISNAFTPVTFATVKKAKGIEFTEALAEELVTKGIWQAL